MANKSDNKAHKDSSSEAVQLPLRDILIVISFVMNLVLVGYILWSVRSTSPQQNVSADEAERARRDKRPRRPGDDEDPYQANQVRNTIIKRSDELQKCYKEFLSRKPAITDGRVTIDWQIDPQGNVLKPEVVSTQLADEKLSACMTGALQSWTFPPPPSGETTYVVHKFNFKKE